MEGFPTREEALADFFAAWEPVGGEELVTLDEAVGRVLARDVVSTNTLPVVRASSFDGIAVKSAAFADGLPDTSGWKLGVDYVRADTGDDFPDDFDAVVMIEKAAIQPDGSVVLDDDVQVKPGSGVRPAGSTLKEGTPLMKAGMPIRATDLAWDWIGDAHDRYSVGDQILVRVRKVQRDSLEDISIEADVRSVAGGSSADNLKKVRVQSKYAGRVTDVHRGVVFIRLSNGVNAIAHSCYDRRMPGKKDDVSFAVTHLDEDRGVAMGIITRIIKQNL